MVGRRPKLTDELEKALCHILENGTSVKDACALVGIGERTFYEWVAIGNAHFEGKEHPRMPHKVTDRERFVQFAQTVTRARARMRDDVIKSLVSFARAGNVQAAMFLLERSDPENWGKQSTIRIPGLTELLALIAERGMSPGDVFEAMMQEMAEADAHSGDISAADG